MYIPYVETVDAFCPGRLSNKIDISSLRSSVMLTESAFARLQHVVQSAVNARGEVLFASPSKSVSFTSLELKLKRLEETFSPDKSKISLENIIEMSRESSGIKIVGGNLPITLCHLHSIANRLSSKLLSPGLLRTEEAIVMVGSKIENNAFVPPLPRDLYQSLMALDEFITCAEWSGELALVNSLLVLYQVIAIHPFRDGNARVAQVFCELLLRRAGVIGLHPLLLRPQLLLHRKELRIHFKNIELRSEWTAYLVFGLCIFAQAADLTSKLFLENLE